MVSRPYEANLGRKKSPEKKQKNMRNYFSSKFCFSRLELDSRRSRELNWRLGRPGEGQGGPNKGHLDPKIGQNLRTKNFSDWSVAQACIWPCQGLVICGHDLLDCMVL